MRQFIAGKSYLADKNVLCDKEQTVTVVHRTKKFVTIRDEFGDEYRHKIHVDGFEVEYIMLDDLHAVTVTA